MPTTAPMSIVIPADPALSTSPHTVRVTFRDPVQQCDFIYVLPAEAAKRSWFILSLMGEVPEENWSTMDPVNLMDNEQKYYDCIFRLMAQDNLSAIQQVADNKPLREPLSNFHSKATMTLLDMSDADVIRCTCCAEFLNAKDIVELFAQKIADLLNPLTTDQMRTRFHIENDWTPETLAVAEEQLKWAKT